MTAPGARDEGVFPWAWDQYQRYAVLREILAASAPDDGRPLRVLDVGGVSPCRSSRGVWFPVRRIHNGPSIVCDVAPASGEGFVRADGGALPFADGAFDAVAAMDVLEHVPAAGRRSFLRELCRVSSGLVVLSAPFRNRGVEAVENLLFDQQRRLYGIENYLLLEHRRHGLPDPEEISGILAEDMAAGMNFGFGGLAESLLFHYIRNSFLVGLDSERVLDLLDRFFAARGISSEPRPPFARMFWVYGRDVDAGRLAARVRTALDRLTAEPETEPAVPTIAELAEAIHAYRIRPTVSALVVLPSQVRRLAVCLDYLRSQEPDFNFEVCVWDPGKNPDIRNLLAESYPDVRVLGSDSSGADATGFLAVRDMLRGDPVILVSERVRMPRGAVSRLYAAAMNAGESFVLAPRTVRWRYFDWTSTGRRPGLKKLVAGRFPRPGRGQSGDSQFESGRKTAVTAIPPRLETGMMSAVKGPVGENREEDADRPGSGRGAGDKAYAARAWLYGECLVFRKGDAGKRRFPAAELGRRDIFLWEIDESEPRLSVVPDCRVFLR